jgi:hypothetical protein
MSAKPLWDSKYDPDKERGIRLAGFFEVECAGCGCPLGYASWECDDPAIWCVECVEGD